MKKSLIALAALLLVSPVFADEAKSEQLLTLAAADISPVTATNIVTDDNLASDSDQEVKCFGRLLSAKIEANLPEQIAKHAVVNITF